MGADYFTNPAEFLINTVFGLYILAIMLRFLLQCARADFYNPLSQFLVKITSPVLKPLRRVIPGWGGVDIASLVLMLVLQLVALGLIMALRGQMPGIGALLILSFAKLLALVLNVYLVTILIQVIFSWINPGGYNPAVGLLYSLNEPVLRPARRLIPPVGGLDLSPLIVLIGIQLLKMLLLPPLFGLAQQMV